MIKKYFAKGKRGIIYTATYKKKKVAIKIKNPDSDAKGKIKNEAKYLRLLNKYKIGPKLISFKNNELMYEFIEGDFILDYIKNNNKKATFKILKDILNQLRILDKLKINKEEMHRPFKHIIIKNNATLIDFERAYKTKKPHNVTQFCQFVINTLKINRKALINLAKKYKSNQTDKNFKAILKYITK